MLLDAKHSHLVVVDLQERLMPAIHDGESVLQNARILLAAAARLGVPVTVTEQYPKGLGNTVQPVQEALPPEAVILAKTAFSAARDAGIAERVTTLRSAGRDQLVVCGTEAHICVLQSALGIQAHGRRGLRRGGCGVEPLTPQRRGRLRTAAACGLSLGDDGNGRLRMAGRGGHGRFPRAGASVQIEDDESPSPPAAMNSFNSSRDLNRNTPLGVCASIEPSENITYLLSPEL